MVHLLITCMQMCEADIIELLEEICDPDTDNGDWITEFDLQENGDKLELVDMRSVCVPRVGGPALMGKPTIHDYNAF